MAVLLHRVIGDFGDETQRAFRADHQMLENLEGVLVIDQRVEAVTAGVFDLEFIADAFG